MSRPKAVFTLDRDVLDELNHVAAELKEKKSHIVEKTLTLYFDAQDIKIADKRMKDVKEGKSKLIPFEEVYKNLGLFRVSDLKSMLKAIASGGPAGGQTFEKV